MAKSSERKCQWALRTFNTWKAWRNEQAVKGGKSMSPIRVELVEMTNDELCFSLTRFLIEVCLNAQAPEIIIDYFMDYFQAKKANGEPYPAETLYELLMALQMYLSCNGRNLKLLADKEFTVLRNTLDSRMKQLSSEGFKARQKQAEVITADEENQLWATVLGDDTPTKLLDTIVYSFGLHFALRACQEHRNLRFGKNAQVVLRKDHEGRRFLRYTEDTSKARQGGINHRKIKPKVVDAYENRMNEDRCIVRLFEKYCDHRPPLEECKTDSFYLRPLQKPSGAVWFSTQPVGRNSLSKVVSRLCEKAGSHGHRTNHSLRATAASRLYQRSVDEQLISEVTGHRSTAVRTYKRTTDEQKRLVSECLQSVSPKKMRFPSVVPAISASVGSASSATVPVPVLPQIPAININVHLK